MPKAAKKSNKTRQDAEDQDFSRESRYKVYKPERKRTRSMSVASKQGSHVEKDSTLPVVKAKCKNKEKFLQRRGSDNEANYSKSGASKVIDPCLKNVLNKELAVERAERSDRDRRASVSKLNKGGIARRKIIFQNDDMGQQVKFAKQASENNSARPLVEEQEHEDLDYYDDMLQIGDGIEVMVDDTELAVFEDGAEGEGVNKGNSQDCHSSDDEISMVAEDAALKAPIVSYTQIGAGSSQQQSSDENYLKSLFNQFFEERCKQLGKDGLKDVLNSMGTKEDGSKMVNKPKQVHNKEGKEQMIKSPSDTTIYAPAVAMTSNKQAQSPLLLNMRNLSMGVNQPNILVSREINQDVSNFVETVRKEMTPEQVRQRSEVIIPGQESARAKVDATIIEAEKFRAKVAAPPGMLANLNPSMGVPEPNVIDGQLNQQLGMDMEGNVAIEQQPINREIGSGLSDDDFFHLTSHIDPLLKQKIENGEFVDLDKLLPKDRVGGINRYSEDNRMEWVQRDGGTFLVPAKRDSRITNFRKWEQAFRMYATIYCGQNPHRAKEIWQYISVINTAASAYVWENV